MKKKEPKPVRKNIQNAFFQLMGGEQQFRQLLEYLPDVEYFAKDKEGRFVAASARTLRRIGARKEEDILGMRDDRIHPKKVAAAIREDDLRVMETRRPMIDRVEALFARTRASEWFLTTKLPIVAPGGAVIGVMGFVRPYRSGLEKKLREGPIQRVIAHVQKHHRSRIPIATLVDLSQLSQRQLNRKFHETFQMSVQQFIMRTRVQAASKDLLGSSKSIGEIALDHGFYDQSFFTRYFKQHLGETPLTYRRRRRLMEQEEA